MKHTSELDLSDIFAEYPKLHEAGIVDAIDAADSTAATTEPLTREQLSEATSTFLQPVPTREGGPRQH